MRTHLLTAFLGLVLTASNATAQVCAGGYERPYRPIVMAQLSQPAALIARLQELATESAEDGVSPVQRHAYENEFKADRDAITQLGDSPLSNVSARTNSFLGQVINAQYLGLDQLSIDGATDEEAQDNSREAANDTLVAFYTLERCLSGSWDRITIIGTPNNGQCEGSFSRRDAFLVGIDLASAVVTLNTLKQYLTTAVTTALSSDDADLIQYDYDYQVESLYLRSIAIFPWAQSQTQAFLMKVTNPVYLGVSGTFISGPIESYRIASAKAGLDAIANGQKILLQCSRLGR